MDLLKHPCPGKEREKNKCAELLDLQVNRMQPLWALHMLNIDSFLFVGEVSEQEQTAVDVIIERVCIKERCRWYIRRNKSEQ